MRLLLKTKLANLFFSIVFLTAIAGGSYLLFESRNLDVARKNVTISISPSEMAAGQDFQVDITQTLVLLCPYEVHWSLSRASDHVEVLSVIDDIRPAHTATGPNVAKSHHFLPPGVAPGQCCCRRCICSRSTGAWRWYRCCRFRGSSCSSIVR